MIIIEFLEKTKIKSSHNAEEVNKFSSIGEFNYVQDLRTNLLQDRENDGIPRAKKQRRFKETIPNSRVQDIKEEFHGLSEDEWKKYKDESKQNENRRRGEQRVRVHSDYSASVERNPF